MTIPNHYDVLIIGGSYAGLSAAMALGRSRRSVLIIDSGLPCNRQTPQSHNFLTQDGESPAAIARTAKAQVVNYPTVQIHDDLAISGTATDGGFEIITQSGHAFQAKKLVLATGIKDILPDIKGFDACWGISVIHCPYCHGYEYRDQRTGIMAKGERGYHLASLVNNLTDKLTLLTSGAAGFTEEQRAKLLQHQIPVIETEIVEVVHENGHIRQALFQDGSCIDLDALYAGVPFRQHSDIPVALGCTLTEQGYLQVDLFQKTNVPGIYACGDNSAMMRSVANAVYSGNLTGAMVNKELIDERY